LYILRKLDDTFDGEVDLLE